MSDDRVNDALLVRLFTTLCTPLLEALAGQLTTEQQRALDTATLVNVSTKPAAAQVLGFGDLGPMLIASFAVEALPVEGLAALAALLEAEVAELPPREHAAVGGALMSGNDQLVVNLRPDKGEATMFLVAAGDVHLPIKISTKTLPAAGVC